MRNNYLWCFPVTVFIISIVILVITFTQGSDATDFKNKSKLLDAKVKHCSKVYYDVTYDRGTRNDNGTYTNSHYDIDYYQDIKLEYSFNNSLVTKDFSNLHIGSSTSHTKPSKSKLDSKKPKYNEGDSISIYVNRDNKNDARMQEDIDNKIKLGKNLPIILLVVNVIVVVIFVLLNRR